MSSPPATLRSTRRPPSAWPRIARRCAPSTIFLPSIGFTSAARTSSGDLTRRTYGGTSAERNTDASPVRERGYRHLNPDRTKARQHFTPSLKAIVHHRPAPELITLPGALRQKLVEFRLQSGAGRPPAASHSANPGPLVGAVELPYRSRHSGVAPCWSLKSDFDTRIPAGHAAFFNSSSYTRIDPSSGLFVGIMPRNLCLSSGNRVMTQCRRRTLDRHVQNGINPIADMMPLTSKLSNCALFGTLEPIG